MRVDNVLSGALGGADIKSESGLSSEEYINNNIRKAMGHAYRAANDVYDILVIRVVDDIERLLADISRKKIHRYS